MCSASTESIGKFIHEGFLSSTNFFQNAVFAAGSSAMRAEGSQFNSFNLNS